MLIDFRKLFPKYGIKPKGVLHCGANVGEEATVYNQLGIKNVIWIEANPDIHQKLVMNVAGYDHKTFCFAVGDTNEEEVTLHVSNNGSQSSSVLELGTHKTKHPDVYFTHDIKVPMFRIDSFFSSDGERNLLKNIDFLNLDLQGFELKALRGIGDIMHQFKWAYIEVNQAELYLGCPHVNDLDLYLNGFGFKRVETKWCGNTGWGDALYIKRQ